MSTRANVEHSRRSSADVAGTVTVQVWARKIRVKRVNDALLVTGEQRLDYHERDLNLDRQFDFLATYRKARGFYSAGILPPHIQFANARDEDDLIRFVQDWGPVWGRIEGKETNKLSVLQFLEPLRREHRFFSNAAKLLAELGKDHPNVRNIAQQIATMAESRKAVWSGRSDPTLAAYSSLARKRLDELHLLILKPDEDLPSSHPRKRIIYYGHETLCYVLNRFPPVLVPDEGKVVELPQHQSEGIRPALYFMLREDYLRARKLKPCANDRCRNLFVLDGRSRECCTPACSKVVRDYRYYYHGEGRKKRLKRYKATRGNEHSKRSNRSE